MDNLSKNWTAIKDLAWNPFLKRQIYIDEYENIFALKNKNEATIVVAYGHVSGVNLFQSSVIRFIKDVKATCKENKWNNVTFKLILNIPLRNFKYLSSLRELPSDVEYFYFDTIRASHTLPILQNLQKEIDNLIESARSRKEDREDNDAIDIEYRIMNGLIDGDAEKYGF